MTALTFNLCDNAELFDGIVAHLKAEHGQLLTRDFPDGETYVRIDSPCAGRDVVIVCSLDRPNPRIVPLLMVAQTLRDLGARRIGLVTPYLAYMRQDARFVDGEGVTARYFAALLSSTFDWLVTVDPHLHRIKHLDEVYSVPTTVVTAAPLLAQWVKQNVAMPLLIGPDMESEQWVSQVAQRAAAPYRILHKTRRGDRDVCVSIPDVEQHRERTPVLIDDIASTGRTFVAAIDVLRRLGLPAPVCLAVHGVFAGDAWSAMREAGAARIVTCNTIVHASNEMDVSALVAAACQPLVSANPG